MNSLEQTLRDRCHASCRTCVRECVLLQQLGVNGLGLVELRATARDALIPFSCTGCDLCAAVCTRRLNPAEFLRAWREEVVVNQHGAPAQLEICLTDRAQHIYSLYRRMYSNELCVPAAEPAEILYFPGCALSAYTPELAMAAFEYLQKRFPGVGWLDGCCYNRLDTLGLNARYAQAQEALAAGIAQRGARRIITACPTCHYRLSKNFPALQVVSIYQILAGEMRKLSSLPERIAVHDSCADRFRQEIGKATRSLLPETLKLAHEGKRSLCCGAGSGVDFANPGLSQEIAARRWAEVQASGAQLLITYCTNCAVQLSSAGASLPVWHILEPVFGLMQDYSEIADRLRRQFPEKEASQIENSQ